MEWPRNWPSTSPGPKPGQRGFTRDNLFRMKQYETYRDNTIVGPHHHPWTEQTTRRARILFADDHIRKVVEPPVGAAVQGSALRAGCSQPAQSVAGTTEIPPRRPERFQLCSYKKASTLIPVNEIRYEWDERKNLSNQRKHGVSFEEAVRYSAILCMSRSRIASWMGKNVGRPLGWWAACSCSWSPTPFRK